MMTYIYRNGGKGIFSRELDMNAYFGEINILLRNGMVV